jgi:hypothetical protein
MENGPFIDDFPINTSIYKGFSMAMLNNQMVNPIHFWRAQIFDLRTSLTSSSSRVAKETAEPSDGVDDVEMSDALSHLRLNPWNN